MLVLTRIATACQVILLGCEDIILYTDLLFNLESDYIWKVFLRRCECVAQPIS
jgi:hypothetical protein